MGGTESVVQALTGTEFASRMESIIYAAAQIPQGGVLLLHLSSALARHRIEVDRVERDVHFCRHRFCDGFLLLPNTPAIEKDMVLTSLSYKLIFHILIFYCNLLKIINYYVETNTDFNFDPNVKRKITFILLVVLALL